MKIIIDTDTLTDNVTSITASSEDAAFPATNLQNDFTTDLYRAVADVLSVTLTILVSKGSAVALVNTNATSATVTAGTGGSYENEAGYSYEAGYSNEDSEQSVTLVYDLPGTGGRLWADYTNFTGPHIVKITLTAATTVYAGIVRAGTVQSFADPAIGLSEGSKDYSVEKELNNGADYFRKRNVVRTFGNLSIMETRANCYLFKQGIFDAVGPKPLAIRLVHNANITDKEFVVFAKRISPPEIVHRVNRTYSIVNFDLKEVI